MSSLYQKSETGIFYWSRYVTQPDGTKKKISRSCGTRDLEEAIHKQNEFDHFWDAKEKDHLALLIQEAVPKYLAHRSRMAKNGQLSLSTLRTDRQAMKLLQDYCFDNGIRFVSEVDTELLNDFKTARLHKVAPTTALGNLRHIQGLFTRLYKLRKIEEHPFDRLDLPQAEKRNDIPLESAFNKIKRESKQAAESDPEHWEAVVTYILSHTGMRLGEVVRMKWEQGENDIGSGHSRSYVFLSGRTCVIYFKRRKRSLNLNHVWHVIEPQRSRNTKGRENPYVFGSPIRKDQPMRRDHVSKGVSRFLTEIGFPKYTAHTLRHGFISEKVRQGFPLVKVGRLVGHSHTAISEGYLHLVPGDFDGMLVG